MARSQDAAPASSKSEQPSSKSEKRLPPNTEAVDQCALARRCEAVSGQESHDFTCNSKPSQGSADGLLGWYLHSKDGAPQPAYRVPGFEKLFSLEAPNRSLQLIPDARTLKRARSIDLSLTEEPKSTTTASHGKRRAARRTRSPIELKPRCKKRLRTKPQTDDPRVDEEDDEETCVSVSTTTTFDLYLGDVDALGKFYAVRFGEVNQTFVKQFVAKWMNCLEPDRGRVYGAYTRELPGFRSPTDAPPWWPRNTKYVEPAHLEKEFLLPIAVDMMLIHRDSDKSKRNGPWRTGWVLELKKHVDYVFSTCPDTIITSSREPTFIKAMREHTAKVMHDVFQVAQSHEDHLLQYEAMGIEDNGRGKHYTWSKIPKPPKQTKQKSSSRSTVASIPEDSGSDTEIGDSPVILSPKYSPSLRSTPQSFLQTTSTADSPATAAHGAMMASVIPPRPELHQPALASYSPRSNSGQRNVSSRNTSQDASSSFDHASTDSFLPTLESRRNSEPHAHVFQEPQRAYAHTPYDTSGLQAINRELCAFPMQPHPQFVPIPVPEFPGYSVPQFQTISTSMPADVKYFPQPGYTPLYAQESGYMGFQRTLPEHITGYASNLGPDSPMDSKMTTDSCNTSFSSMSSDVDMTDPASHALPCPPNIQQSYHGLPYGNPHGGYSTCGTGQCHRAHQ